MRPVLVLPFAALVLALSACGSQATTPASPTTPTAEPTGTATTPPTTPPDDEWSSEGPLATSMPTRTCVAQESPVHDNVSTSWMNCFDSSRYATEPPCAPPPGTTEGLLVCTVLPKLTQRVVDDWNQYADEEDRASAERQELTFEEYRRQHPDQHEDGSPVDPTP